MSSGAKQILQIAKETVRGVIPTPFDRVSTPFTEVTLNSVPNRADAEDILDTRLAQPGAITSVDHTGDVNASLRFGTFDDLLAAAAFNEWGGDTLTFGGSLRQTFSITRGYSDINNYHTFSGVHVNTLNIEVPEDGIVTVGFGLIGMGRDPSKSIPSGTVTNPTLKPPFTSVSVGDILIDGVSQAGKACISAFSFNWDNGMQPQTCLGLGLRKGAIIETSASGTGSITIAWSENAAELYEGQFANKIVSIVVPLVDSEDNTYLLTIPKLQLGGELPTGGRDEILQASFDYTTVLEAPTLKRTAGVPVTGVTVAPSTVSLTTAGATRQLTATVAPPTATNKTVTWVSSDNAVATVDDDGLVTAVANGKSTITAISDSGGFEGTSLVTVEIP